VSPVRTFRSTCLGLLLLLAHTTLLAKAELTAFTVPADHFTDDRTIELVIQIDGSQNSNIAAPRLPGMTNLKVVAGPDRRISSSWVNGQFSSMVQLRYTLVPQGVGVAEIPAFGVLVDGESLRTERIRFTVVKAETHRPAPPSAPGVTSRPRGDDDVFLRAELGDKDVWVGQAVPLSVSLFAGGRISNPAWRERPALSNFWVEDLEVDPEAEAFSTTINNRRYIAYPLERRVLIPQAQGEFEIEPYVLQLQVRARGSDPFDIFSLARGTTVVRRTEPLKLHVKALPDSGRPAAFGGAVGTYEFSAALDRDEVAANDAVALRATVEGDGFLLAVEPPRLEPPPGVKLFDPEVSSSSQARRGKLVAQKTWEWILVPTSPGEVRLPPLEFHYFDPQKGRYEKATQTLQPLVVRPSDEPLEGPRASGEILQQRRDLAFIKPLRGPLREQTARVHRSGLFVALLLLPLIWAPLVIVLGRRRARLQQDRGLARGRKAGGRARKRLRAAGKHVAGAQAAGFHEEVALALVDYVADRFNRASAGLTYETADELLASKGLDPDLRRRFRTCLETCDFARFVPAAAENERRTELLREAEAIIEALEKER
jgi:hypothetical protein